MESDKNPFPQLELFPRISRAARFIGNLLTPFPTDAPMYMSDHYRGGAAMLDRELYDNPNQLELDYGRDEQTL